MEVEQKPSRGLTEDAVKAVKPVRTEPKFSGLIVTPWQLVKNPFLDAGKLVRLDLTRVPVLVNGVLNHYGACESERAACLRIGGLAVRPNRRVAARDALYDVMGVDGGQSVDAEKQGELLVTVDGADQELGMTQDWLVIPEQPTEGHNGFGASISVAIVRFVRYASDPMPRSDAAPSGNSPE